MQKGFEVLYPLRIKSWSFAKIRARNLVLSKQSPIQEIGEDSRRGLKVEMLMKGKTNFWNMRGIYTQATSKVKTRIVLDKCFYENRFFQKFYLFFLLLCSSISVANEGNCFNTVICAVFKNEGRFLKEWLSYHKIVGFEHVYLYDDYSNDDYRKELDYFIQTGYVTLIERKVEFPNSGTKRGNFQLVAYDHFLKQFGKECVWCAYIDLDEFIVPLFHNTIGEYLEEIDDPSIGSIYVKWQNFGTSNVEQFFSHELITELLRFKAVESDCLNTIGKSIVKTIAQLKPCNYHHFSLCPGYRSYVVSGDEMQINHYLCRDRKFFYNVRCILRRNPAFFLPGVSNQEVEKRFNQEVDLSIQKFVPAVKNFQRNLGSLSSFCLASNTIDIC